MTYINEHGDMISITLVIEHASIFGPLAIEVHVTRPNGDTLNYWVLENTRYGIYTYNTNRYGISAELHMWLSHYAGGEQKVTLDAWVDAFKKDIYVF